jgi:hypothetical protein
LKDLKMHSLSKLILVGVAAMAVSMPAVAQTAGNTAVAGPFPVIGNVPALCAGGTLSAANGTFDVGVLIDTSTGFLLPTLSAPNKVLNGAFCSSRSTITVSATPMTAQNFTAAPPTGFSRTVNYTATASGWTDTAAAFTTGAATNAAATQSRSTAFTGNITVGVANFTTGGGNTLRMVADTNYQGLVTVTLAVAN